MFDVFNRTAEKVLNSYNKHEENFVAQKEYIIRNCNDNELQQIKSFINKIEKNDFVEDADKKPIINAYQKGLICKAAQKELLSLLKMRSDVLKDLTTLEENGIQV